MISVKKPIDIIDIKRLVREGKLNCYVDSEKIYLEDTNSGECVEIGEYPVVRGHWAINPDGYYPYCSKCGCEPVERKMTNYCSNCGCKMNNLP